MTDINPVVAMLARRGFELLLYNPTDYLFFPPGIDGTTEDALYGMLRKYSFRIFMRDVIKYGRSFGEDDLLKYSTRPWVRRYIDFLMHRGVVKEAGAARYRLKAEAVFSFGDTLEWFVAKVFEREFSCPAVWGARIKGVGAGGDYDVIASLENGLVYAEVKSSPPKNIEEPEVAAFIRRTEALCPSMAVFIEDTTLRMTDKIVPFFDGLLRDKGFRAKRLQDETFIAGDRLYITNSKPDIVANIGLCIRHHLTAKGFW